VGVFEVRKDDLHQWRSIDEPPALLADGQVRATVDAFGLSANNITYAVMGEAMSYWHFFPAEAGWGRMPVWGYATVAESAHPDVAEGTELYGYLPPSTDVVLEITKVDAGGLVDGSAHRAPLPPAYNRYTPVAGDPSHRAEARGAQMVLRPLFFTGFVLEDLLDDEGWYGAEQAVVASASSKTALSTAFLLQRRSRGRVVALTSARNAQFCEDTGMYDDVITYDDLDRIEKVPTAYIDMAGDAPVREAVHRHLGDRVVYSGLVGATHWDKATGFGGGDASLPGAPPTFFFAPDRFATRSADWGPAGLQERMAEAFDAFVTDGIGWMRLEDRQGMDELAETYLDVLDGKADPAAAFVVSLTA
jgi:hypothetical protein